MHTRRRRHLDVLLRAEHTPDARGGTLRAALATALTVALALPVLVWLERQGLVTGHPLLLAALLPVPGLLSGSRVQLLIGGGRPDNRLVLRLLLAYGLFAALLWSAGWPALLPATGVMVAVFHIRWTGSRAWGPSAVLLAAVTVVGQVAARAGWFDTVLEPAQSHTAAAWNLILAMLAIGNVGLAAARREESERALARAEARLRALMDSSDDVLTVSDGDGILTYVSPAAQRDMGHAPQDLVGTPLLDLVDSEHRTGVAVRLEGVVRSGHDARASIDVLVVHASGERRWYEWTVHNLLDDPMVEGLVVDQRDITERLLHSAELQHAASHDDLTGLPNRPELMRRLAAALRQAGPSAGVAVLFIDLDDFKVINDTLGHLAGDDVLVVVARRLEAGLRRHDHLARLGGDEFCAVLTEVRDPAEMQAVVQRIEDELAEPLSLGGHTVTVSASVGAVLATEAGHDPARLFAEADAAMYRTKRSRPHTHQGGSAQPETRGHAAP